LGKAEAGEVAWDVSFNAKGGGGGAKKVLKIVDQGKRENTNGGEEK